MCQAAEGGDIADFVSVQSKVEQLRDIVEKVCRDRIAYYESQIGK
jgi:hypothetical protein